MFPPAELYASPTFGDVYEQTNARKRIPREHTAATCTSRLALDEVRAELEQETTEAAALADELATENETLKATIEQLKLSAAEQQQALASMTTKATAAEAALAECRARAEQLEKQLEREAKKADAATEAAAKAREEAAELRGRMTPQTQTKAKS